MKGTKDQKKYAVIGNPISHSLSPLLHNLVFQKLGENACYEAVDIEPKQLKKFIETERMYLGVNVTIPHKESIIPFLDEIRGDADECGAVNTVVFENEKAIGLNTDMQGLLMALKKCGFEYKNSIVSVFGTGGAAIGAVCKAASEGAREIRIIGRNKEKAKHLVTSAQKIAGKKKTDSIISYECVLTKEALEGTEIFINATPLGMSSVDAEFETFDFLDGLKKGAIVYDMVYRPAETKLVKEARSRGILSENGLSMLIHQALISDSYFLNKPTCELVTDEMYGYIYEGLTKELYKNTK